jgi:hypothetical protein
MGYNTEPTVGVTLESNDEAFIINDKIRDKTIMPELRKYNLPEEIISKADEFYRADNAKIRRQKKRIDLLFYYTLKAYRDIHVNVDPNSIGKIFNLNSGKVQTAITTFKGKKESCYYFTSPVGIVRQYCEMLKVDSDTTQDIINITIRVITKCPELLDSHAQAIASGAMWYHFSTIGYEPDKRKFKYIVGRSIPTVKKFSKRIASIDNEEEDEDDGDLLELLIS